MSFLSLAAMGLFIAAAVTDVTRRRIPHLIVLGLIAVALARLSLFPLSGATRGADFAAALAVLAIGILLFRFNLLGGGDAKLLAAGTLWLGAAQTPAFLMATALTGGLLALLYLLLVTFAGRWMKQILPGLPYGVAIAAGGLICTWQL